MDTLGEYLKRERERKGVTIEEASKATRIRKIYLQAIEDGNLEVQPPVFMRGFLKSYASFLGIEITDVVERYKNILAEKGKEVKTEEERKLETPKKFNRYIVTGVGISFILILAIVTVIMTRNGADVAPASPDSATGSGKQEVADTAAPQPITSAAQGDLLQSLTAPDVPQTPPPSKADVLLAQPDKKPGNRHTLVIAARELTWLRVTIDDLNPFEVLMKEGETVTWTANHKLIVLCGNAGGVDLTFNGKPLGSLGPHGKVVSVVLPE